MLRKVFCKLLIVTVVVFWSLSGVLLAQGRSEEALERAIAAQEKHTLVLMAKDGVEGTAVGIGDNDQFVVKVYTARPGVDKIPPNLEGVPVQKVVTGKIYALADPTARFPRPVPTGVSTGHPNVTAGTIGCRVTDGTNVYVLSNNHVYANENRASIGDNVLQPGTVDGGINPNDAIGTLYDFEPIIFGMWGVNIIDAAIASTTVDLVGNSTPSPPEGYGVPSSTMIVASASLGRDVQKYGRTTGLTKGTVTGINGAFLVRYSRSYAIFYDQIVIEAPGFSYGGDSGSLIVTNDEDQNCNPVGLLFAGSDTMTIANPIDEVLARFNVTMDDGSQGPVSNSPPTATFNYNVDGLTCSFDASDSTDSDGTIISYDWDFGDGEEDSGETITHTYSYTGTYTVTLTVTDEGGLTGIDTANIIVQEATEDKPMSVLLDDDGMELVGRTAGKKNVFVRVIALIRVIDTSDNPVGGATVYGSWSGAISDVDSGITNAEGFVELTSIEVKNPDVGTTFIFTVDDVVKSGWVYDAPIPSPSASITY